MDDLARDLALIVGADHVIDSAESMAPYETDWTGRFRGTARFVVRPGSTDEVAATLRTCLDHAATVVPQGGNTGLVGGAVPHGDVVLSTTRLRHLDEIDELSREVTVGAGATLAAVQAHAAPVGLAPGVDLAARGSATIGGMIATDAGGIHAIRYGSMRRQVVAIEAVLADGTFIRALPGVHLPSLLAGSEGALAVITGARLTLIPVWPERATALLGVDDMGAAAAVARQLRDRLGDLEALEVIDAAALDLVLGRGQRAAPFRERFGCYVLVETAGPRPSVDALTDALDGLSGVGDAAVATDGPGRRRLWELREGVTDAIATVGVPHKLDIAVPVGSLGTFSAELCETVARADGGARVVVFGHLGLGNLHVNVIGPDPDDEHVDDAVLRLVLAYGGSVSAEHGIGRAKARWLPLTRSRDELAVAASLKQALDPKGMLNPGVMAY